MPNKWDEEEVSEDEKPVTRVAVGLGKKWDDEEDEDVLDSWDAADDSEEERAKAAKAAEKAAVAAKDHKSKTERIAEHQKQAAAVKAKQEAERAAIANETPAERRKREEESDFKHAEALFSEIDDRGGDSGVSSPATKANKAADDVRRKAIALADPKDPSKSIDLSALPLFNPSTKQQFTDLQNILTPLITANLRKAQYPLFVQELVRNLVKDMSSENIKKVASIVTTLSNEKLREEKAATGGKKNTSKVKKQALVGAASKESDRIDTKTYEDAYVDDDFM